MALEALGELVMRDSEKKWLNDRYFGTGFVGVNFWNKSDIDIIDEGTPVTNRTAGGSQTKSAEYYVPELMSCDKCLPLYLQC